MGEIGTPVRGGVGLPARARARFAGRTLPAPARPEKLLEATYGPNWKVPDPAFHFATPRTTYRRLNGWFRGTRVNRNEWDGRYSRLREKLPARRSERAGAARRPRQEGPTRAARRRRCRTRSRRAVVRPPGRADARPRLLARRGATPVRRQAERGGPRPRGRLDEPPRAAVGARPGSQRRAAARHPHAPGQPPHRRHRPARAARRWRGSPGWRCPPGAGCTPTSTPCDRGSATCRRGRATATRPKNAERVLQTLRDSGAVIVHSTQVSRRPAHANGEGSERPVVRLVAEWRK